MLPEPIRLQKYMSQQGVCSRRAGEILIRQGKVTVNGQKATLGDKVKGDEVIMVEGESIGGEKQKGIVYMYNKPKGVQCTMKFIPGGNTLADVDFGPNRVFPIGRLDAMSHGLLLMTNDGELAHRLMHPKFEHEKEYVVKIDELFSPTIFKKMERGMMIDGTKTAPCRIEQTDEKIFRITLKEGRNRQIRRMVEEMNGYVRDLQRVRVGPVNLGRMHVGTVKRLTRDQYLALRKMVDLDE